MHDALVVLEVVASVGILLVIIWLCFVSFILRLSGPDRRDLGQRPEDPVWTGKYSAAIPLVAEVSPEFALAIATTAVEQAGGSGIEVWDGPTIVGWYPRLWQIGPARQIAIVLTSRGGGFTEFLCCSRPRYAREVLDLGMSRQRARKVAAKVMANVPHATTVEQI